MIYVGQQDGGFGALPTSPATPTMNQTQNNNGLRNDSSIGKEREQERPYVADIPVSLLNEPRAKAHMKKALLKTAKETQQGVKIDDNATEASVSYYLANIISTFSKYRNMHPITHVFHRIWTKMTNKTDCSSCYILRMIFLAMSQTFHVGLPATVEARS